MEARRKKNREIIEREYLLYEWKKEETKTLSQSSIWYVYMMWYYDIVLAEYEKLISFMHCFLFQKKKKKLYYDTPSGLNYKQMLLFRYIE
jgi:hypothetical protein